MLQPHSFLWHYLWLAPHVLQVALAMLIWRSGLYKSLPAFLVYLIFEAIEEFTLYGMDVLPSVSFVAWWRAFCIGVTIEGLVKFALIGELFFHLLLPWLRLMRQLTTRSSA